jgi:hypothetical protein
VAPKSEDFVRKLQKNSKHVIVIRRPIRHEKGEASQPSTSMKFGKRLQFEAGALGALEHVLDYKALKRVIKGMVARPDARVCSSEHIASPFVVALRAEWARLAPFFLQREGDLQRQWRRVLCLFESPTAAAAGTSTDHEAKSAHILLAAERERCLLDLYDAILALRKCVSLNFLGACWIPARISR